MNATSSWETALRAPGTGRLLLFRMAIPGHGLESPAAGGSLDGGGGAGLQMTDNKLLDDIGGARFATHRPRATRTRLFGDCCTAEPKAFTQGQQHKLETLAGHGLPRGSLQPPASVWNGQRQTSRFAGRHHLRRYRRCHRPSRRPNSHRANHPDDQHSGGSRQRRPGGRDRSRLPKTNRIPWTPMSDGQTHRQSLPGQACPPFRVTVPEGEERGGAGPGAEAPSAGFGSRRAIARSCRRLSTGVGLGCTLALRGRELPAPTAHFGRRHCRDAAARSQCHPGRGTGPGCPGPDLEPLPPPYHGFLYLGVWLPRDQRFQGRARRPAGCLSGQAR